MSNVCVPSPARDEELTMDKTKQCTQASLHESRGQEPCVDNDAIVCTSFPNEVHIGLYWRQYYTGRQHDNAEGASADGFDQLDMSIKDFITIAKQCRGKTKSFVFSGAGGIEEHKHFRSFLRISRLYGIAPNVITSGTGMTPAIARTCKRYCDTVTVVLDGKQRSFDAAKMLIDAGVKTNVRFILGKDTIDEAIYSLYYRTFPMHLHAVIFSAYKPDVYGNGAENMLNPNDMRLPKFFKLVESSSRPYKIELDGCILPGMFRYFDHFNVAVFNSCGCNGLSCYIGPDMVMIPCVHDMREKYGVSLKTSTIKNAWNGERFKEFRDVLNGLCPGCHEKIDCMGGCPILRECVLCSRKERNGGREI